ncbi:MAG: signal peptidase II [Acholeplasmatales bacterium]|jgi:signal peptidase II|nr:signal peptidase II [Acholeplasmatales bacterium]
MWWSILIIALSIILDQVFKLIAGIYQPSETVFIKNVIHFSYVENSGASYGILPNNQLLLAGITIVALGVFGYLFYRMNFSKNKVYAVGLSLIVGGTLGNAIDRVMNGYVVDFLYYPFLDKILPNGIGAFSNNPADLFLFAGLILLIIHILFLDKKGKKSAKDQGNQSPKS